MSPREPASRAMAHTQYYLTDGTKVPSVTGILRVIGKGDFLMVWANNLGLDGFDYTEYRKAQAGVGTLAHYLIASELRGESVSVYGYSQEEQDRAANVVKSFRAWRRTVDLEPLLIEEPLVSETARYGGTIDLYARLGQLRGVIDLKSSNDVYDEHHFQTAGYARMVRERGLPVDFTAILRCGRDGASAEFVTSYNQDCDLAVFDAAHGLYLAMKARETALKNVIPVERKRKKQLSVELVVGGRGAAVGSAVVTLPPIASSEDPSADT